MCLDYDSKVRIALRPRRAALGQLVSPGPRCILTGEAPGKAGWVELLAGFGEVGFEGSESV